MLRTCLRRKFAARIYSSPTEAIEDVRTGAKIAIGGFGTCGVPENLIQSLRDYGNYDFTVCTMSCGVPGYGTDLLISSGQLRRIITTHIGASKELERKYLKGEIELELTPEGTLAERIRAAGAGIPGFYTRTGVNTLIEDGEFPIKYMKGGGKVEIFTPQRESRVYKGVKYLFEEAISTDFSIIKAWKADTLGNLVYNKTAGNFNSQMAMCSRITIAEVEEIVEPGELDPEEIVTPGIFVQRIVKGEKYEKPLLPVPHYDTDGKLKHPRQSNGSIKIKIAERVAQELDDGTYVHLGMGLPSLVSNFVQDRNIFLHTSSGIIGAGPYPRVDQIDHDLVNTSRDPVTIRPGGSISTSIEALDMLRGGHLNVVVVGAFQVSKNGDLANWLVPGKYIKGMGSSMDCIAHEDTRLIVAMVHTHHGSPKIVKECTVPVTGKRCVDLLVTELGVFDFTRQNGLTLVELAKGVGLDEVRAKTGCSFNIASDLKTMS